MLYTICKFLMQFALKVYFKRIYFSNVENIPKNSPLILACNHPNSFLDAIILATLLKRPLHFLARSDVFDKPWKRWLLAQIHLIPIYRLQEGVENLGKNEETFDICEQILKKNGVVLIFSEGICVQEKRLRTLKKGTAKLALQAELNNDFQLGVEVVCVGVNYTYPTQFRSEVLYGFEKPFAIADYRTVYSENPAKAILQINRKLQSNLQKNMVILTDETEKLTEQLLIITRNNLIEKSNHWLTKNAKRLDLEIKIAENIKTLAQENTQTFQTIANETQMYFDDLEKHQISDKVIAKPNFAYWKLILLLLGFPFFLIGYVLNFLPLKLANNITQKKVKRVEFFDSVRVALGFLVGLVYYIIMAIVISILVPAIWILVYLLAIWLLGYFALYYLDFWADFKADWKMENFKQKNKESLDLLIQQRKTIIDAMQLLGN